MKTALLLMTAAIYASTAYGQDAQMFGLIRDPSNLSVAGADITLRNEETGGTRNTASNESGFYSLPALRPGIYRLLVRAPGFETVVREGIRLEVGDNARLDFALKIGSSQNTITVRADQPLINTSDASVGTVIDRNLIDQMPLNGRGIQTLIELTPGVTVVPVLDASRGQFAINGQRSDANYFTVDGVSANFSAADSQTANINGGGVNTAGQAGGGLLPANNFLGTFSNLVSPEALQEFKIQTSTYAPEFGHQPGGQVSLISRSGTNHYSGSLFEYFRNDQTDANDWFNDAQGLAKPPLRFNNFGGTLGGPVKLPRIYNGYDRTFFFFSADILTISQPQPAATMLVPSLTARENAPPALAALLDAYPLPSNDSNPNSNPITAGLSQFVGASQLQYSQGAYGLRIDHNFSGKLSSFVRFDHAPSKRIEPIVPGGTPANVENYLLGTDSITVGFTHSISPSLVNEIRLNASRQSASDTADINENFGAKRPADSVFLPPFFSPANSTIEFSIAGNQNPYVYLGMISRNEARQLQGVDNLFHSHGAHLLKFGVDYRWFSPVQIVPAFTTGWTLNGIYAQNGSYVSTIPEIETEVTSANKTAYSVPSFAAYAQDTWRLNPKFTINYGVRWEIDPAPHTNAGQALVVGGLTNLNDISNTYQVASGQPFYPTTYTNLAPRFGMAWQVFSRDSSMLVLRAGGGAFYDSAQGDFEDTPLGLNVYSIYNNQPLGSIGTGTPSQTFTTQQGIAIAAAPDYKLPVTYQWNVALEEAIGQHTFTVGYVGAVGRRLIGSVTALPASLSSSGIIQVLGNDSSSSYHALQLQFNRRLSQRLQILISYTWSHSIDNLSNDLPAGFALFRSLSQYLDPNADRGSSDFDIRHSLNGAVIAALPSPPRGITAALFRNWSANSIFFARSALPTDILSFLGLRPNYVPGQPLYLYGSQYPGGKRYNPAAFASAQILMEGDFGRNVMRGFGAWQIDFALHRTFKLAERLNMEFRAEAFNILNHPNFANPSDPGAANYLSIGLIPYYPQSWGTSTAMLANGLSPSLIPGELNPLFQIGGPRTLQFALRLRY